MNVKSVAVLCFFLSGCALVPRAERATVRPDDSSGFVVLSEVVPDVLIDARYYGTYNFIGNRLPGYEEPVVLLTREAAEALKKVSAAVAPYGYRLKVFDGYRPQRTVDYFMTWASDRHDVRMKDYFYPELEKKAIIPQGYVATRSGHTRGSTVDLTLFDMKTQRDVDMGCTFDYFGRASHPSVRPGEKIGLVKPITREQYENRQLLRRVMVENGFKPFEGEWWHFSLKDEPYPDTYFTFPVKCLGR